MNRRKLMISTLFIATMMMTLITPVLAGPSRTVTVTYLRINGSPNPDICSAWENDENQLTIHEKHIGGLALPLATKDALVRRVLPERINGLLC